MQTLPVLLLLCVCTFSLDSTTNQEIVVNVKNGAVHGTTKITSEGQEYFAFLGIPYAEPPTGELRFKAPVAKSPWKESGILDATKDGSPCVQYDFFSKKFFGTEDCLFLNVYTKNYSPDKKYPVMVWIHGGGFMFGESSSWMYGPSKLIANDVVVVSFNYRLGCIGFLSTKDEASPGNYGLLDQVEALKWVKSNIDAFGGDSNKITIFGESAGSISVTYQVMSPLTKGLFHKAIALSGTATTSVAFGRKPQIWAKKLGKFFSCPQDHYELVKCLRKIPALDLIKSANEFTANTLIHFPPVIDGKFLPIEPHKAFEKGLFNKIPIIIGTVKDEGIGLFAIYYSGLQEYSEDLMKKFVRQSTDYDEDIPTVISLIKERYLKDIDLTNSLEFSVAVSKMFGDSIFYASVLDTAKNLVNNGVETYIYNFEFESNYSLINDFGISEYLGVAHADDLVYLFDGKVFDPYMRNDRIKQVAAKFVKLLTNFAKFGDATRDVDVKWPKSVDGNMLIYHINEKSHVTKYDLKSDSRIKFWLKTIPENIKKFESQKRKEL